jgi:hypothetical protein
VSFQAITIDEQLTRLEKDIRRLKVEFDVFFSGGAAKPPHDTKYRVESHVKQLYDSRDMAFAQRFRYNSLVARFNSLKELWRRNVKDREEGRVRAQSELTDDTHGDAFDRSFASARVRCSDPQREPERVRELFNSLVNAKRTCGNRIHDLTLDQFEQVIGKQMTQIKSKLRCESVVFTVEVDQGVVKLTAKAG